MALNRVRFGDYINLIKEKCGIPNLTPDDVSGINRDKEFFEPSKQVGGDTSNYKIVPPNCFACNIMHVGRDAVLPIALNTTNINKIVSPAYTIFEWTGDKVLLKEFLFMMLKSSEKDRYFWFHCDSSVRDGMDWDAFCDIELDVPPIEIQKKYVAIYEGMLANLRSYEKGLEDLKLVCDGFIEDLRKKCKPEYIGPYMIRGTKNSLNEVTNVLGVGQNGFIKPQKKPNESLANYKIIEDRAVCYAPPLYNILSDAIHVYRGKEKAVCSPIYEVFYCNEKLNSEYLLLWLKRKEFKRYAEFYALGVRNTFDYDLMTEVKIPIPDIDIQIRIVDVFKAMKKRTEFVENLKSKISILCPILIRGSILEAQGGI